MIFFASCSEHCRCIAFYTAVLFLVLPTIIQAAEVKSKFNLELTETYKDVGEPVSSEGVTVSDPRTGFSEPGNDVITEVKPGVELAVDGAHNDVSLDYTFTREFWRKNPKYDKNYHELNWKSSSEISNEELFVDTSAVIQRDRYDQAGRFISSSLGTTEDRNYKSYGVYPKYRQKYNGVEMELDYSFKRQIFESELDDSRTRGAELNLRSPRLQQTLQWDINATYQIEDRERANDVVGRRAEGNVKVKFKDKLNLLGRVGSINDDVLDDGLGGSQDENNGGYVAGGFEWLPNRKLSLSALYGTNLSEAAVHARPSRRTQFDLVWTKLGVGQRTDGTVLAAFSLKLRRTEIKLSYSELETTEQEARDKASQDRNFDRSTSFFAGNSPQLRNESEVSITKSTAFTTTQLKAVRTDTKPIQEQSAADVPYTQDIFQGIVTWRVSSLTSISLDVSRINVDSENDVNDSTRDVSKLIWERSSRTYWSTKLEVSNEILFIPESSTNVANTDSKNDQQESNYVMLSFKARF